MLFRSLPGALNWYVQRLEGNPKTLHLAPRLSGKVSRNGKGSAWLVTMGDIGKALDTLAPVERAALVPFHVGNRSPEDIRLALKHKTGQRWTRREISGLIHEAETVLAEELEARGVLHPGA